jgi:hypothetical protein
LSKRIVATLAVVAILAALVALGTGGPASGAEAKTLQNAVRGRLRAPQIPVMRNGRQVGTKRSSFLSSGLLKAAEEVDNRGGVSAADDRLFAADGAVTAETGKRDIGISGGTLGCRNRNTNGNVRVNQDCTFRRNAENDIVHNPAQPTNLLAGSNDSRVGYNQCSIAWSLDNGRHWGDLLPPFRQKLNNPEAMVPTPEDPNSHTILGGPGTLHTYDAGSDPSPAMDSRGRGFFSCVTFDVASNASMVYVTQSPRGAKGSFFYNLGTGGPDDRNFVVAEDNSPLVFHDKEFIAADSFKRSPNRDNVYVTWTVFRFDPSCRGGTPDVPAFCRSPIFGSMSTDHGFTWSTPEEISGANAQLCFTGNFFDPSRPAAECNNNQGSDPTVLPNGDLVVPFNNANTALENPSLQQLAVRCAPSGDSAAGTAHLNCAPPTKVGDDVIANEPVCDFGRGPEECIPGPWIRTNDFPRSATHTRNGHVYVTWQDYREGEFDIQLARSTDGGRTWSATHTVNPDRGLDHYFPAVDVAEVATGRARVGVSYYRSERVPGENTSPPDGFTPGRDPGVQEGLSDYVLAGGRTLRTPFNFTRLSPVFVPPDGVQAGFNGDYTGLTINFDVQAHPVWSDTRNRDPFAPNNGVTVDEDYFTVSRNLPSGTASTSRVTRLQR